MLHMITIFCIFCKFSANKLAFFSKTNVTYGNFFAKTYSSLNKTPIFTLCKL
jgi:hypothetical protein